MTENDDIRPVLENKRDQLRSEIAELQSKMRELLARRDTLEKQLSAVSVLLGENPETRNRYSSSHLYYSKHISGKGLIASQIENKGSSAQAESSYANLGLRDAIRRVLFDAGRAMRPKEVTAILSRTGYSGEGQTDLSVRINNEMWRMAKNKLLAKTKPGLYKLPQETMREYLLE